MHTIQSPQVASKPSDFETIITSLIEVNTQNEDALNRLYSKVSFLKPFPPSESVESTKEFPDAGTIVCSIGLQIERAKLNLISFNNILSHLSTIV